MKLERTIQADINESTMRERITAYFQKAGYQFVRSKPSLAFRRGSLFGSLASFSPKGWQVNAVVRVSSNHNQQAQSTITLLINTIGQWVTDRERMFWQNELEDLEKAILTGDSVADPGVEKAKSALVQNILSMVLIVGLAIITTLGARFLNSSRTTMYVAGAIGVGLGLLITHIWLNFKINE